VDVIAEVDRRPSPVTTPPRTAAEPPGPAAPAQVGTVVRGVAAGLAYARVGSGPPIVLIPGLGSCLQFWDPIVPGLTADFEVIALDLPGSGASPTLADPTAYHPFHMARTVAALLAELGVEKPHIVGHSLGGWVALELAAAGVASKVTAFEPAGLWSFAPQLTPLVLLRLSRALARGTKPFQDAVLRYPKARAFAFGHAMGRSRVLSEEMAHNLIDALADSPSFPLMLKAINGSRFDRGHLITCRVTVAIGDRDRLVSPRSLIPSLMPEHTHWVLLPGVGHMPTVESPAHVVRLITDPSAS
jgi:pimeloyl-ACP methyl ester carboxylesterase